MDFDESIRTIVAAQGFQIGDDIRRRDITIGDVVYMENTRERSWSAVSGSPVIRKGSVNVIVESRVRFRPDGPVFVHEHRVPRHEVRYLLRAGVFHRVQP